MHITAHDNMNASVYPLIKHNLDTNHWRAIEWHACNENDDAMPRLPQNSERVMSAEFPPTRGNNNVLQPLIIGNTCWLKDVAKPSFKLLLMGTAPLWCTLQVTHNKSIEMNEHVL